MRTMVGKVYLIGAGPGDPELLTLKAARRLAEADVVLLDALVDRAVLRHVRAGARVFDVGKRSGRCTTPQRFIDRLMLRYARRGLCVARVKGGDPYVFGRGGEEAMFLLDAGVHAEIVNGVSAGIAAPAVAGIPLTNRGIADGVTFVTAHRADGTGPDWHALARARARRWLSSWASRGSRVTAALGSRRRARRQALPRRRGKAREAPARHLGRDA